ncbi:MAG: ABC transporter substrate-binding protein, partial [Rubrivivax sp.]
MTDPIASVLNHSLSRRRLGAAALAGAGLWNFGALAQPAAAALPKVKVGVGSLALDAAMAYVMMPPVLGYWRSEGYDGESFSAQSSVQAIQLLAAGKVDFIQVNSAPMVQAVIRNKLPLRAVMVSKVIDWSLITPEAGPIKTLADWKGKLIGVPALGAGGVPLLESYFQANGIDPKKDITLVAVGAGPAALAALNAGRVQGLMFWASAIAGFEAMGGKYRYFFNPEWRRNPDYMLATLQSTIDSNPRMVEAVARGVAKASLYAMTNPDCVRQLHWKAYPTHRPTAGDEAAQISLEELRMKAERAGMQAALDLGGGKWGRVTGEHFSRLQDLLLESKVIESRLANPEEFVVNIPGFFDKVNAFDHDAVARLAHPGVLVAGVHLVEEAGNVD